MNESILRLILPQSCGDSPKQIRQSSADNDRSLILPIIMLLMAEKADFFLIFALLYILM